MAASLIVARRAAVMPVSVVARVSRSFASDSSSSSSSAAAGKRDRESQQGYFINCKRGSVQRLTGQLSATEVIGVLREMSKHGVIPNDSASLQRLRMAPLVHPPRK